MLFGVCQPMHRRRGLLLPLVVAAIHSVTAPATAAEPTRAAVHVFVVGSQQERVRAIFDAFSRRNADLRLTQIPVFHPADVLMRTDDLGVAARVWIDVLENGQARITIADQRAERFLVRAITLSTGLDELGKETLAQVVESSVAALRENQQLGLTRAQASSVLAMREEPRQPSPVANHWHHRIAAFYQVQAFAPQIAVAQGPGLRWQATRDTRAHEVGGWLGAQYVLPQSQSSPLVGVDLQAIAARLCIGLRYGLGAWGSLGGWFGGGMDAVRVAPRPGQLGSAALTEPRWTAVKVLRAEFNLGLALGRGLALAAAPSLELDLGRRHYDIAYSNGTVALVAPYELRPGLTLALEWP